MKKTKLEIELIHKGEDYIGVDVNGGHDAPISKEGQYLEISIAEGEAVQKLIEAIKIILNGSSGHNQTVK